MNSTPFQNILVCTDFSEPSRAALRSAGALAARLDARLTVLHICDVASYAYASAGLASVDLMTPLEEAAEEELARALGDLKTLVPGARSLLRRGAPWTAILAVVDEIRADLLVVGTHGRRGLGRVLLGSVAEKLVRTSPVPVLTVGGARDSLPTQAA